MDCDSSGDAIDLVALVLRGKRFAELMPSGIAEVRQWFERFTGQEFDGSAPSEPPPPPPVSVAEYPPECEVRAFYDRCVPADGDAGVLEFLRARHMRPGFVAGFDLARALPLDMADLPRWASKRDEDSGARVPWTHSGHRLIVPLYDERGLMRSVLARAIVPAEIKSYAPAGYSRAGLVMACPFARWLLATGAWPQWWPADRVLRVVVPEGETDYLLWASQWSDAAEYAPATLGVVSGSWSSAVAERVCDGAVLVVATDNDAAGDRYAAVIEQSMVGRDVLLERWEARA